MPNVRSKGWVARVLHPDTSRVLRADALADPRIEPSINSLPKIHLPVPRSPQWQGLNFQLEPTFDVFLDGLEQPIDELLNIGDKREQNASILVGRGGVELLEQASVSFDTKRRHLAAQEVIQDDTPYDDDVDAPNSDVLEDEDMQSASTDSEFSNNTSLADTDPIVITNDELSLVDSLFFNEGEDYFGGGDISDGNASEGTAESWFNTTHSDTQSFSPEYVIPESNLAVQVRWRTPSNEGPRMDFTVDGNVIGSTAKDFDATTSYQWTKFNSWSDGDLGAGSHTLGIDVLENSTNDEEVLIDAIVVYDDRFSYTFDNSVDGNNHLDGPELKPDQHEVEFSPATTPFQVIAGTVSVSMDDTGGNQRVQLRNLVDGSWAPTDGTEDNTSSVTVDPFSSGGDRIQLRVRLSRWSENGARSDSPTTGYSGQSLQSYDLDADIRQESLLLDYRRDASVEEILNDIAGDEFFWSYRVVDGTKTVTFTQPGQRTGGIEPQLIKADIRQDVETIFEVEVQGSNKTVSGEQFPGLTTYQGLTETNLIAGSESVRDPDDGTQFTREEDYQLDLEQGRIRITDDGDMVAATTYEITYRAEVSAVHTDPNAPANPRRLTVEIPGVTSDRQAEQLAFVLVEDLKDPRWIGDVTIPPSVATFDVVEALPLDKLGLPTGASPFYIPEPPRQTPRGTEFRLESQPDQQRRVAQLKRQVSEVVQRTG